MNAALAQRYYDAPEPAEAVDDVSAARLACAAIKAIRQCDRTPAVVAHLLCAMADLVRAAGWSHTSEAVHLIDSLDDLSDYLKEQA